MNKDRKEQRQGGRQNEGKAHTTKGRTERNTLQIQINTETIEHTHKQTTHRKSNNTNKGQTKRQNDNTNITNRRKDRKKHKCNGCRQERHHE